MRRALLAGLLYFGSVAVTEAADLLVVSRFAFAGGQVGDAVSSIGLEERNPLLRSSNGQFGWRGAGIKAGIGTAFLAAQRGEWFRRHRRFTIGLNFAAAGVGAAVAVHNSRLR